MNNLYSNCGLTDARMMASEKDLPVRMLYFTQQSCIGECIITYSGRGSKLSKASRPAQRD